VKTAKPSKSPASTLRRRAEVRVEAGRTLATPADELLHELQVHQVELQMQNEELRQAQSALEASRTRYVELFEFAPVGYLSLTRGGLIEAVNLAGAGMLGADRPALIDQPFALYVAPPDRERWRGFFSELLGSEDRRRCEIRMPRKTGTSILHVQLDCQCSPHDTGAIRVAMTDVSERRRAEEALAIAALAFDSGVGIAITDAQAVILRVNRAFSRLTGHSEQAAVGRTPAMLAGDGQTKAFRDRVRRELLANGYWQGEIWNHMHDGDRHALWLTISAARAPEGETTHYVGAFSEITKIKAAEARIHRLAYFDSLTRLPNRRLLRDRIGQAMAASARGKLYCALIFLDLDHFKTLNDTHGHHLGDRVLVEVANRLQSNLRESDTVARLGGDEFVVMLERLHVDLDAATAEARRVAQKIRAALDRPYAFGGASLHCAASLGVVLFRGHGQSIEALLRCADLAMYEAKNAGRNTLRFFDPARPLPTRDGEGAADAEPD